MTERADGVVVTSASELVSDVLRRGPFDLAAWDFDGALADTEPVQREGYVGLLRSRGIELPDDFFGPYLGRTEGEIWDDLIAAYGLTEPATALREERMRTFLAEARARLRPGGVVRALLPALRATGTRQVVLSSGNLEVIVPLLEGWGIRDAFEAVLAWTPTTTSTKRERLTVALTAAERPLVVEDDRGYLAFARSLGAVTVGVVHSLNRERLTPADADLLVAIDVAEG